MNLNQQGGGKMEKKKSKEIIKALVKVKEHKVDVYTKSYNDTIKRAGSVRVEKDLPTEEKVNITSVYHANYKLIDDTVEDIKKMSRKVSTGDYSTNNVYLILQDALKKITLAEK